MRQVLTMKLRLVSNSGSSCLNLPNVVITGVYHQTQLLSLVCQYIPQHALTNGNLLCPLKKRVAFILCIQIFSLMYVHLIFPGAGRGQERTLDPMELE